MNDLMENLQKVMNDPESMKQISQLAKSLGVDAPSEPQPQPQPQSEPDLSKLFSALTSGQNTPQPASPQSSGGTDFSRLLEFTKIMDTASKSDKNTELVLALKPHLKAETQQKADRLIKIYKLLAIYPVLKNSGLLNGLWG